MASSSEKKKPQKGKVIAIDGPAGAGKSTTARLVAKCLGYTFLDTGAMYRAITYAALKRGISPSDGPALAALAEQASIEFVKSKDNSTVLIDGEDVTTAIRAPEVTRHVSEVSAHYGVRQAMVRKQKKIGERGSIVAEGRDTTTVVFPRAEVKVYLNASVTQRAQRRLLDLAQMGIQSTLEEQKQEIERRDELDSNRQHSPLTKAPDAVLVDTTALTIEDQVDKIIELATADS